MKLAPVLAIVVAVMSMGWAPRPETRAGRSLEGKAGFCVRQPAECSIDPREPERVPMTNKLWRDMHVVNHSVNSSLRPITDKDFYGREDYWTIPTNGVGDCEDYQLLKRVRLRALGVPHRAMRLAVVVANGEGHAVLIIRTTSGDYVLDNLNKNIVRLEQMTHRFVMRESSHNGRHWVT